jgi:hypothetical protein
MEYFVGLDVSLETVNVCIVNPQVTSCSKRRSQPSQQPLFIC